VDLHPTGATDSEAYGVSGGQQVGRAYIPVGNSYHASLWNGTAASWVDLNPSGARESFAYGVSRGWQAGKSDFGEYHYYHAGLWNGTAGSWVDLHAILPAGTYSHSEADGIDVSADGETWVTGYAYNTSTQRDEAILWHCTPDPVPEPSSLMALAGGLGSLLVLRRRGTKSEIV